MVKALIAALVLSVPSNALAYEIGHPQGSECDREGRAAADAARAAGVDPDELYTAWEDAYMSCVRAEAWPVPHSACECLELRDLLIAVTLSFGDADASDVLYEDMCPSVGY